jgi:hypothetical protein
MQLLAFGRKQVVAAKILDLNASVREIEKLLHRIIGEDIELILRLHPAPFSGIARAKTDAEILRPAAPRSANSPAVIVISDFLRIAARLERNFSASLAIRPCVSTVA